VYIFRSAVSQTIAYINAWFRICYIIESRIRAFDWYRHRWPWMTLTPS